MHYGNLVLNTRVQLGGRGLHMVLMRSVIYYLLNFQLYMGDGKQLDELMRRCFWKGSTFGEGRGLEAVSWAVMCRTVKLGELDVSKACTMNLAVLTKLVNKIMSPKDDSVRRSLKNCYHTCLDCERCGALV